MSADKIIRYSNRADLLSIGAHIFCCGVPTIAALLSLISTAGMTGVLAIEHLTDLTETWHQAAFYFSTAMVLLAVTSYVIARRRDCVAEGHCAHEPCAPKKTTGWKRLALSLVLYAANVGVFLLG